jgi:hypothetical protein
VPKNASTPEKRVGFVLYSFVQILVSGRVAVLPERPLVYEKLLHVGRAAKAGKDFKIVGLVHGNFVRRFLAVDPFVLVQKLQKARVGLRACCIERRR